MQTVVSLETAYWTDIAIPRPYLSALVPTQPSPRLVVPGTSALIWSGRRGLCGQLCETFICPTPVSGAIRRTTPRDPTSTLNAPRDPATQISLHPTSPIAFPGSDQGNILI